MTQHDDRITLRQMLDHAEEVVEFSEGRSVTDFETDRIWSLAMVRLLLIIGEAANRLSTDSQTQLNDIPWAQVIGFRNRLAHGYDTIDYARVWSIMQTEIPALVQSLEALNLPEFD